MNEKKYKKKKENMENYRMLKIVTVSKRMENVTKERVTKMPMKEKKNEREEEEVKQ